LPVPIHSAKLHSCLLYATEQEV